MNPIHFTSGTDVKPIEMTIEGAAKKRNFQLEEGSQLNYTCRAGGADNGVHYSWMFTPIGSNSSAVISQTSTLSLSDLEVQDSGVYTCRVYKADGTEELSIKLDVTRVPSAIKKDALFEPADRTLNNVVLVVLPMLAVLCIVAGVILGVSWNRRKKKNPMKASNSNASWG